MIKSLTFGRTPRAVLRIAWLFLLGSNAVLADTLWTHTYGGPYGGDEAVCAILTDADANVVVIGSSKGESGTGGSDFVVIKYSWFHGSTLWTRRITGADTSDDVARAAATDPTGTVTVTGQSGKYPDYNLLTVQLNRNGSEIWRAYYDGTAHGGDVGTGVAADTSGSVFVTGYAQNASMDFVTAKYNWDGSRPWAKTYDGGGDEKPTAIALGPGGSVYVTGHSVGNSGEYITVKYSATGVQQWVATYNGPHNAPDATVDIAVDAAGSAYVTGWNATATGPGGTTHSVTVKYDSAGAEQWVARYERDGSWPAALALGASALYVAGKTGNDLGDADYVTIAYDYGTGDTLWVRRDSGPAGSNDAAVAVAVGPDSGVWVAGSSNYDFVSMLYTPDGVKHWVETYGTPGDDQMAAMAIANDNKVVVAGITWVGAGYDLLTVAFDTIGPAVAEPRSGKPLSDFRLSVAPNPSVSGIATLRFGPARAGTADVTVFGADGRVVLACPVEIHATGGSFPLDLRKFGAGVYMVRIESGGRSATRKLVVEH